MAGIVRQRNELDSVDLRTKQTLRVADSAVVIVVREVDRDPEGFVARVAGHLLIQAGLDAREVRIALVGVDRSGDTTVVERWGRSELSPLHEGRHDERLDFVIDVRRRMPPAFETPLGRRWWELRATVRSAQGERRDRLAPALVVRQAVAVPAVRRSVHVETDPAPQVEVSNWIGRLPSCLRPAGYAFDPTPNATGRVSVRSRGDWGVIDVPEGVGQHWCASIVQYEQLDNSPRSPGFDGGGRIEAVYSRPLVGGPNTLEFLLPADMAPSHEGPLLTTRYELRVHTDDGRRLGARHRVEVLY